jgi:ectoine hydroxylase-related dioxygenase (phytanoyl-CoA dioxygenase family)
MITDLKTKGFAVVNNFLSSDEIEFLINNYYGCIDNNKNYNAPLSAPSVGEHLGPKINNFLKLINQQTDLQPNFLVPMGMFVNTQFIDFAWHQDHESYYLWQHHYDAINFYIPLIKPEKNQTGLSIVPMDALSTMIPAHIDNIVGKGAKTFKILNGNTRVIDDIYGTETVWNFDINDLSVSPELSAGDLLLLRGDIIHKTQDLNTNRLAISLRCFNRNAIISKKELAEGSRVKQRFIENNPGPYKLLRSMFDELNTDTVTAEQLFFKIKQALDDNT